MRLYNPMSLSSYRPENNNATLTDLWIFWFTPTANKVCGFYPFSPERRTTASFRYLFITMLTNYPFFPSLTTCIKLYSRPGYLFYIPNFAKREKRETLSSLEREEGHLWWQRVDSSMWISGNDGFYFFSFSPERIITAFFRYFHRYAYKLSLFFPQFLSFFGSLINYYFSFQHIITLIF